MTDEAVNDDRDTDVLRVEYCGEWYQPVPDRPFLVGREGDLRIDDNPFLHRHFLKISRVDGMWWLENVGDRLSATVTDPGGHVQAWLTPQARLPLVFSSVCVLFTAGATTYELTIEASAPVFSTLSTHAVAVGETTLGPVPLTPTQKLLLVALAEPLLRRSGTGSSAIPSSAQAAERLGWPLTTFNRKLDNVCEKLARTGVRGLRGGQSKMATNRRSRLVEHAMASRLVTRDDLELLPAPGR
jgi:hypothetical protein